MQIVSEAQNLGAKMLGITHVTKRSYNKDKKIALKTIYNYQRPIACTSLGEYFAITPHVALL